MAYPQSLAAKGNEISAQEEREGRRAVPARKGRIIASGRNTSGCCLGPARKAKWLWPECLIRPEVRRKIRRLSTGALMSREFLADIDTVRSHKIARRCTSEKSDRILYSRTLYKYLEDAWIATAVLNDHKGIDEFAAALAAYTPSKRRAKIAICGSDQVEIEGAISVRSAVCPEKYLSRLTEPREENTGFGRLVASLDPTHMKRICNTVRRLVVN
jgi:hypothetical protein